MHKIYAFLGACMVLFCFSEARAQIVVSELNYNSDSTVSAGDWVELWNNTGAPVDISGWKMVDGNLGNPPFTIPNGTILAADGRIVLADNLTKFDLQHPGVTRLGPLGFEFSNSGEAVTLQNNLSQVKVQFTYTDSLPWNKCADGFGRTLELLDPTASPSNPANWRCGCIKGSPGAAFTPCTAETLLFSEINYHSLLADESGDWVEIWNTTNGAVNLSGYKLRDKNNENVYTFPGGTVINPQDRLVVYNDAVNFVVQHPSVTKKVGPFSFGFGADGDAVRLYNASDRVIQSLWYDDDGSWYKCADGEGSTLELALDFTPADDISDYSSWFCGCPNGSPATPFINSCGLGVNEAVAEGAIRVWPNPTANVLYLELSAPTADYAIVAMDGKTWARGRVYGANPSVDVASLPVGIYVLTLTQNGHSVYVKWVKN